MERNRIPDCRTEAWTGASGYKVYDPFCPVCQEEQKRKGFWIEFWIVVLGTIAFTFGIIGLITGIIGLIRSLISP